MKLEKKVILLAGPTASGKSKLAIKLGQYLNGEIINADSMQIYKEFSILTSKPNDKELKIIKHHLYGFNTVKKNFSVGLWLKEATNKIREQWEKGKTPIVVGGTGLYFKALTDGLADIPDIPSSFRKEVRKLHKRLGQNIFFSHLIKLDPLAKKFIIPTDTQRSMRAFEVKKFTNKSLFEYSAKTKSKFDDNVFAKFFINIPKEKLHKQIEKRVEKMFKEGAVEEVKKFYKMGVDRGMPPNKVIGVKEINDYLNNKISLFAAKELIMQKTRQYAKKQFTWARGHMKSWEMVYSINTNDLLKKTINKIS